MGHPTESTAKNTAAGEAGAPDDATQTALGGPVQDSRFRSAIDVSATAGDNWGVARVEFLLDGTVVATDTTAPYSATIDLSGKPDGRPG